MVMIALLQSIDEVSASFESISNSKMFHSWHFCFGNEGSESHVRCCELIDCMQCIENALIIPVVISSEIVMWNRLVM
jgi:hypothetical protein